MDTSKQTYVLDTSALITKPTLIHSLPDSNIILAIEVLEELDSLKIRDGKVGVSARYVNRYLDEVRTKGDLQKGIDVENNQTICVSVLSAIEESIANKIGLANTNDNKIIGTAKYFQDAGYSNVKILTNDIAFRVKANIVGVEAEAVQEKDSFSLEMYRGIRTIQAPMVAIDNLYREGTLKVTDADFTINEGIIVKNDQASCLAVAISEDTIRRTIRTSERGFQVAGLTPRSAEQFFACEFLLNPEIDFLTIAGISGTGKTMLAVATAIEQLHTGLYRKLIISRPAQSLSKDIGFLPGIKSEKMAPWIQPIFDNIDFIYSKQGHHYITSMLEKGDIEIEALPHIRGRSLPDTIFLVDEAQNINYREAKALLTRMGENSKLILTGDLEQIDTPNLNMLNSGLAAVVNIFKPYAGAAHVTLTKGERSALAAFAAKNM